MNKQPENLDKKPVSQELSEMAKKDQEARQSGITEKIQEIDQINQEKLSSIIKSIGWPTISKVGEEASHFAWLIAQHADAKPEFQRECFAMMRKEPESEISHEDMAYLADRIRINEGKPQLFGTQWKEDPELGYVPEEIEDREHLDERRAELGMDNFDAFSAKMQEFYAKWKDSQERP